MRRWLLCAWALLWPLASGAAQEPTVRTFTHADTLRGANTPQRSWWDVAFYDLHVTVHPADSTIAGYNGITYRVLRPAPGDADRPAGAAHGRQHGAGRAARHLPPGRQRVLRVPRDAPASGRPPDDHRLLPRQAARGQAAAVGRRAHLGARQPRQPVGRDGERGPGRQRVVAEQGLSGRRAGQPAGRDHGARPADRRLERPAARGDTASRRHDDLRVVRHEPDQQLRRRHQRRDVRALHDDLRRRSGPAHDGLLAAGLPPRGGAAPVHAGAIR